jgi:hypothetical protein
MRPQRQQPQQDHDGQRSTRHDQDDLQRRHYLTVADLPSQRLTRTSGREPVSAVTVTTFHARERVLPRSRPAAGQRPRAISTDSRACALSDPSARARIGRNHP